MVAGNGHRLRLIAFNYIVNLEKLGLADERTTQTVAFKTWVLISQGLFAFKLPVYTHDT